MLPPNTRSKVVILAWGHKGDKQQVEKGEDKSEKLETAKAFFCHYFYLLAFHFSLCPGLKHSLAAR